MSRTGPPQFPLNDSIQRMHFRLGQIVVCTVTIAITCWCYTIHPYLGVTMTFLCKHILVALIAAGLELPDEPSKE